MAQWHRLAKTNDVPPGSSGEFTVAGRIVALFHTGEGFYALDGVCPHAGGPLGKGTLQDHIVTCPWHGWQFDVTTGQHCLNATLRHTTFPVRVEGDDILVQLPG